MKLFALLLLGIVSTAAFSEWSPAVPVLRNPSDGVWTATEFLPGSERQPSSPLGVQAASQAAQTAAAAASTAHAIHHGSRAGEAIAAAAQAGLMYKLLMDRGVMDALQRKEMDKSLQIMNKKIEALQKDVQTGKMTPAELAAIKLAVEEAYAKNSKFEAPKDKEVAPGTGVPSKERSAAFDSNPQTGGLTAGRDFQKALLQKDSQQPSDIAQLGAKASPDLQGGKTLGAELGASAKNTTDLGRGPTMGSSPWVNPLGNSMGQSPFNPQVVLNVSADNHSASDNKSQSRGSDIREEVGGNGMGFASGMDGLSQQDELPMNQQHYLGVEETGGEGEASLVEGSSHPKTWLGSVFGQLLDPVKVQKNPFSKDIYNQEGIHPLVLLGLFVGALALGFRLNRGKKTPVVVPEVLVGREEATPISRSTAVVIPMRRADRRYQPRA